MSVASTKPTRAPSEAYAWAISTPTTPPPSTNSDSGIDLARQLDASLISFEGTQHTVVFKGVQCVDTAIVNYFVNLTRPGDLHC